jgi:hypothetical protein
VVVVASSGDPTLVSQQLGVLSGFESCWRWPRHRNYAIISVKDPLEKELQNGELLLYLFVV